MKKFRKIGVLTSGGDAPGMNAAIRAVVRTAILNGVEAVGVYKGYSGLIKGLIHPLGIRAVSNTLNHGGTMLYSDRCPEFKTEEGIQKAVNTCRSMEIDGIVAIGGDGTFRGATDLTNHGIPCVGLPGTIDNDVTSTEATIGYDSALNTTMELIDRLRDTCESHARCSVIEVMGRNAGDLAVESAIAAGATAVVIPEVPFSEAELIERIHHSRELGKRNFLVIVSEGMGSKFGEELTAHIQEKAGVESRFTRFGHVVRGGNPTLRDRMLGTLMGEYAVQCLLKGQSDIVICKQKSELVAVDINFALIMDRMYKNTLKEGDLEKFTPEQVEVMKSVCQAKRDRIKKLSDTVFKIGL